MGKELWTDGREWRAIAASMGFNEQDEQSAFIASAIDQAVRDGYEGRSEIAHFFTAPTPSHGCLKGSAVSGSAVP